MDVAAQSERLISEIKRRAALFCTDNFTRPTPSDLLIIENAMLIGASISNEVATADLREETDAMLSSERDLANEDRWVSEHVKQQRMGSGTL